MNGEKNIAAQRDIVRVTWYGVAVNLGLSVIKLVVGVLAGSMSLAADGIHSLSDLTTDFAVFIGVHFGAREPDKEHPWGHGRFESFAALIVSLILITAGGFLVYKAAGQIARIRHGLMETHLPGIWVVMTAVFSIGLKELLFRITRRAAVRHHSSMLYANAWHHRSDAISSVAVLAGMIAQRMGFVYGDQVAAVAVGILIILVGVRIMGGCIREFAESRADNKTLELITEIIESEKRIQSWHRLRTRIAGREVFMDLHILVDPELNICQAHEICETLENTLHERVPRPMNIMVHIEPDLPDLRKEE